MAITDAYATTDDYREVTGGSDAGTDSIIARDLKAVSRALEEKLGQFFNVDVNDVTRIFVGNGKDTLWLPPSVLSAAPTTIKIDEDNDGDFSDETALVAADYELRPLNATVGPEPGPYNHIVLTPWGAKGIWPNGIRVQVVGKFGWPAVPDAIKVATIEITRLLRLEGPRATSRIDEVGATIGMSGQAKGALDALPDKYRFLHGVA